MKYFQLFLFYSFFFFLFSCREAPVEQQPEIAPHGLELQDHSATFAPPEWHKNATIYEVNLRQFSEEGGFAALEKDLPRLKSMGVDMLWLMPIFPISEARKKPPLGSPYAVADYKDVNPEFGTRESFKSLVEAVHQAGMYIILDWVPNHTGWDHPWITEHPDWYTRDENGNITDPINTETGESWGWTDVADLNYEKADMRRAMIDALVYWVKEMDIDGYRMDVAHSVPNDFFTQVNKALFDIKPVFMLAEGEVPEHRNSGNFIMSYAWRFKDLTNAIAKGEKDANDLEKYFAEDEKRFRRGYHMYFTTNHDENSWQGTVFERLGEGHKTFAVLAATAAGMPLVYNGQEEPLGKRLKFFEKDPIRFKEYAYQDFYTTLLTLKKRNKALWNGAFGGDLQRIPTDLDSSVFAYTREKDGDKVVVILNLSDKLQEFSLGKGDYPGEYTNVFANSTIWLSEGMSMRLNPWDYLVLSNQ